MPSDPKGILIDSTEINRPGLHMAGYFEFFDERRIQIIGKSEEGFLSRFTPDKAEKRLKEFFEKKNSSRMQNACGICKILLILNK